MIHAEMLDGEKRLDVNISGNPITVLGELHMLIWVIFDNMFKYNADRALDGIPNAVRNARDHAQCMRISPELAELLKNNKFGGEKNNGETL